MPLIHPVPAFNFFVFMANERSVGEFALSLAVSAASDMVMGSFSQVDGLEAQLKIEDYEEGGLNTDVHRFATRATYGHITFKRGVTPSTDIWDWYYTVVHGKPPLLRKSGLIVLADRAGLAGGGLSLPISVPIADKFPIAAWTFRGALPVKLTGPSLNAKTNEIAIETLEISHQGLDRLGAAMIPGVGDALAAAGL